MRARESGRKPAQDTMNDQLDPLDLARAGDDFRRAHFQALLQDWLARLSGRTADLLSYEEVRTILQGREGVTLAGAQDVPLVKIVGSVGRYRDFTQAFLPRNEALLQRWQRVGAAMSGIAGLPPIDLYQVGELYFVRDGNHRVSVARARGDQTIEAFVTRVEAPFPVEAESAAELSAWLIEAGHRLFLERTHLTDHYPDADIRITEPGRYRLFDEQIQVHRYFMGLDQQRDISDEEAVCSWYEHVYLPLTSEIRASGVLKEFPRRTEADLYLWICQHREELRELYQLDLSPRAAVSTFASVNSEKPISRVLKEARLALARATAGDDVIIGLPPDEPAPAPAQALEPALAG